MIRTPFSNQTSTKMVAEILVYKLANSHNMIHGHMLALDASICLIVALGP